MRISDWSSDVCSSDLRCARDPCGQGGPRHGSGADRPNGCRGTTFTRADPAHGGSGRGLVRTGRDRHCGCSVHSMEHLGSRARSEEHTSELQSLMRTSYAVFCLKKKKKKNTTTII